MITWTRDAETALEAHLTQLQRASVEPGLDINEVGDDLRRHVEEEIRVAGRSIVSEGDVRRLLPPADESDRLAASKPAASSANWQKFRRGLLWIAGVVLPALALLVELITHAGAAILFDPLPTWFHVLLIALVPLTNARILIASAKQQTSSPRFLIAASGLTVGITAFYTFRFALMTPFAVIGILYFGIGLLPLSPLLATVAGTGLAIRMRRASPTKGNYWRLWWSACCAGILLLAGFLAPPILTRHFAHLAISDSADDAQRGIYWLRRIGSTDTLLMDCYGRFRNRMPSADTSLLWGGSRPIPAEPARELFYRVTGRPFNTVAPPQARYKTGAWRFVDDFEWDESLGGDSVSGVIKGLKLVQSRLDAKANADEAWGYTEWTLEFQNDSAVQREARAQIALPPGAVVSRVTLWVDGEEREAAFAGRAEVKAAYKKVAVQQRRDPLLVTTSGPDRVLMQCFPIAARGGRMKVRLGITIPLALRSEDTAVLHWPLIQERNFSITHQLRHAVWIEANRRITDSPVGMASTADNGGTYTASSEFAHSAMMAGAPPVVFERTGGSSEVGVERGTESVTIIQRTSPMEVSPPEKIFMVVDGSELMRDHAEDVVSVIRTLSAGWDCVVLPARDDVRSNPVLVAGEVVANPGLLKFSGGHDNVPALTRAWSMASETPGAVVVWIHAPQPVLISAPSALEQALQRASDRENVPRILDIEAAYGPNRITELLPANGLLRRVPREGTLLRTVEHLTGAWSGQQFPWMAHRELIPKAATKVARPSASRHVARLWANEEVHRLIERRQRIEAVQLACAYQLVTPVSGAVVLETQQQYEQNNLKPADPSSVPTVPDSGGLILMLFSTCVLLAARLWWTRFRLTSP